MFGSENRGWRCEFVERLEDLRLDCKIFRHRLKHKLRVLKGRKISRCFDPADDGLFALCIETFFIDVALQALVDRLQTAIEKLLSYVVHDHVVTGARRNLGDPIAHRPCTNNTDYLIRVHLRKSAATLSIAIAPALPPPRHSDTMPRRAFRLFSSYKIVVNSRDPDCPIAWPNATAPPFTFTFSGSSPSSPVTATAATENASFTSNRSTSLTDHPVFLTNFRTASTGPMIANRGSTPAVAWPTIRAIGSTPRSRARCSEVATTADAPSFTPGALPAVTVPSGLK